MCPDGVSGGRRGRPAAPGPARGPGRPGGGAWAGRPDDGADVPSRRAPAGRTRVESSFPERGPGCSIGPMDIDRRAVGLGALAASAVLVGGGTVAEPGSGPVYGLISQLMTRPEQRDALVRILAESTKGMPGCLSYVVALDATRDDAVWITEVWTDSGSHAASLRLPGVQAALTEGRPLITGMGSRATTHPVAGV